MPTRDRTGDLQIFSLTLSQLSYRGLFLKEHLSLGCYNTCNTTIERFGHIFYASGLAAEPEFSRSWCQVVLGAARGANGQSASFQACPLSTPVQQPRNLILCP